MKLTAGS